MKHIFIINPTAGKSDQTKSITKEVNKLFMDYEIDGTYRIECTKCPGDAKKIAHKYAQSNEEVRIYACGGDGTLNEVLNGCFGYDNVAIAPIPIGTGNDFVKSFGPDGKKAFLNLKEMLTCGEQKIDVLEANGNYGINIINIGLDAQIAANVIRFKKLPFVSGKNAYNISLLYCFFTSMKNSMQFLVDGKTQKEKEFTFSVMANGQYYGGSYQAAPFSDMQDGLIDLVLIPTVSRTKILKLMNIYKNGEHLNGEYDQLVRFKRCRKVEVLTNKAINVCVDGEIIPLVHPVITIHPQSLRLIFPEKFYRQNYSVIKRIILPYSRSF